MENIYRELCERAYMQIAPSFKSPYNSHEIYEKILADLNERPLLVKDIMETEAHELKDIIRNEPKTFEHCRAVAEIAKDMAYRLHLDEEYVKAAEQGGLIHDIGKLFNGKYNGNGKITEREKAEHVIIGETLAQARSLAGRPLSQYVANAISSHHDRPGNGEGSYPHRDPVILLPTAVIQPADTWHAMAERGGYQGKFTEDEIANHLIEGTKSGLYMLEAVKALVRK